VVIKWYGWKGKILRVDLSQKKIFKQELPEDLAKKFIGCRGLITKILYDEVNHNIDPLGPDNKIIFGTGPLDGTPVGVGRFSVITKSTRGCMIEGGLGGFFGPELKFAGYDVIVIQGKAEKPVYIWINDEIVEIRDASHLWGKTTKETNLTLMKELGDPNIQVCCIGPAGENLVHAATIIGTMTRSGGRGVGTIMGAKKLKAIAVRGNGDVEVAKPKEFEKMYDVFLENLDIKRPVDPYIVPWALWGPCFIYRLHDEFGNLPTLNTQRMNYEFADLCSGEVLLKEYVVRGRGCFCCPLPACGRWLEVKRGPYAGLKSENIWLGDQIAFTSMVGIDSLEVALKARNLCNELGLDVYQVGYSTAWAMECYERGILTKEDTGGLNLHFGNREAFLELIEKIPKREGLGKLLADGVAKAAEKIGRGSERFALTIKGQELETMPQRSMYVVALGVATSPSGPDHTRWYPPYPAKPALATSEILEELRELGMYIDFKTAFETRNPRGKGQLLRFTSIRGAIAESVPTCIFLIRGRLLLDFKIWRDLLTTGTGVDFSTNDLVAAGERILAIERCFNAREGFKREHDIPPRRMLEEPLPERYIGPIRIEDWNYMLDEYYEACGWDKATGIPTRKKLEELGLQNVADEMEKLGLRGVRDA